MSTPFFVITPDPVLEADLISSDVPENDHPVWNPATTYMIGDRVIVTTGHHKVYQSLTDNNINFFPPNTPARWQEVGPTNRFGAFDEATGTFTRQADSITFTVTADRPQSIALLELVASKVRVRILLDGEVKYDSGFVKMQDRSVITNAYDYAFADIELQTDYIIDELPIYTGAHYEVTVQNMGGIAQIGNLVIGRRKRFGFTQYGATLGIIDSSRKDTDQFGRTTIVERRFRRRMNVSVVVEKSNTDGVARELTRLRAKPALYVGAKNDYELLTVYGFPRDWSVNIEYPTQSAASFEIEGL